MGKWDNHIIGEVPWINSRRERLDGCDFIQYVDTLKPDSILEIGGGELIEAQKIRENNNIPYHLVDISNSFLAHAKELKFDNTLASMEKIPFEDKSFDLVYCNCILEHSPDIIKTIKEIRRVGRQYYIILFKWKYITGSLESEYHDDHRFYSSNFNIFQLLDLFGDSIKKKFVTNKENKQFPWKKYTNRYKRNKKLRIDTHRNSNYLHIIGEW